MCTQRHAAGRVAQSSRITTRGHNIVNVYFNRRPFNDMAKWMHHDMDVHRDMRGLSNVFQMRGIRFLWKKSETVGTLQSELATTFKN